MEKLVSNQNTQFKKVGVHARITVEAYQLLLDFARERGIKISNAIEIIVREHKAAQEKDPGRVS